MQNYFDIKMKIWLAKKIIEDFNFRKSLFEFLNIEEEKGYFNFRNWNK